MRGTHVTTSPQKTNYILQKEVGTFGIKQVWNTIKMSIIIERHNNMITQGIKTAN